MQSYDNKFETAVKLFKLNFKEGYPAVFLTNATYFDNVNNTLPNGMDVTSKLIIDANMFDYELVKKDKIKTNRYFNLPEELYPRVLTVYIEEYDVTLKSDKKATKAEKKSKDEIQKNDEIDKENTISEESKNETGKTEKLKETVEKVADKEENAKSKTKKTDKEEKIKKETKKTKTIKEK